MNTPDYPLPPNDNHQWSVSRPVNDQLFDIDVRLQAIEKQLARLIPLIEVAERYLAMTPLERVRASLKG